MAIWRTPELGVGVRSVTADDIAGQILAALVPEPDRAEDDVCLLVVRRGLPAKPRSPCGCCCPWYVVRLPPAAAR